MDILFILFIFVYMRALFFIATFFLLISNGLFAKSSAMHTDSNDLLPLISDTTLFLTNGDSIVLKVKNDPIGDKKFKQKLLAGFLSFPFPTGFLGAHRILLGTKPWVPVVYVATFGGCFGLLPLIDFCVLMWSDDIEQYENNPNIFMWVK